MVTISSASPAVFVAALLLSSIALAGQLHIDEYGLDEIARRESGVALAVVESTGPLPAKEKGKSNDTLIELRIEKVWGNADAWKPGSMVKTRLYGGVVWDNPRKSPIDRRLDGAVGAKKGDRVIAVPSHGFGSIEVLPATDDNLLAVRVLFDEAERKTWLASDDATLKKGLARADLAALALEELGRRGSLGADLLLKAERQFLFDHVGKLGPAKKRKFLDEAAPLAKNDKETRDRVFQLATYDPKPETVGGIVALLPLLDLTNKDDRRRFEDVHLALVIASHDQSGAKLDLSPFADYLVTYERTRPQHKSDDDDLAKLTAFMSADAKAKLAIGFLESAHSSTFSRKEIDEWLLWEAARLAKEAPSASIVPAMKKVDPGQPRVTSSKESAMGALLQIGTAIVTAIPAEKENVRAILQPLLDRGVPAEREEVAAWRAVAGP